MNEKKKTLVVMGVLAALLLIIVMAVVMSLIQSNKKLEEVQKVMDSKKPQIIYLSKPTCYYCNLIEPITSSLKEEFNLDYFHINTGDLSNSELLKVLEIIGIDVDTFGTPYIAVVQDGKIVGQHIGYTDENVLFDLFKEYGLIDDNVSLNMNYIDVDDFDELWNQDNEQLLLIGESGNTASIDARIILRKLAKEYNLQINYFDTAKLQDSTDYEDLLKKLNIESLPVLLILKNGNILSSTAEASQESYEKFLESNSYIK